MAEGTLESPVGVDVDELGFIMICPGLSTGNARQASLNESLRNMITETMRSARVPKEAYVSGHATSATKPGSLLGTSSRTVSRYSTREES